MKDIQLSADKEMNQTPDDYCSAYILYFNGYECLLTLAIIFVVVCKVVEVEVGKN